jgi:hypothetical protein
VDEQAAVTSTQRSGPDEQLEDDTQAFVVRVWHEATDDEGHATTVRGSIDHVGSGKRLYFHDLSGIVRFIQEYMSLGSQQSSLGWKSLLNKVKRKHSL